MRDIASLNVRQVRIYDVDIIPFRFLRTKFGTEFMMDEFRFKESGVDGGEIFFAGGSQESGEIIVPINIVTVNDRRIIIDVPGPTEAVNLVFDKIIEKIAPMDGERKLATSEPLIVTNETQCVVRMDFSWHELLAEPLVKFLSEPALRAMEPKNATARISSMDLKFTVAFSATDPRIAEHGITLSDKNFIFEPRVNTPLDDKRYFTYSPLDSTAHLILVNELEQAMVRRGKSRKALPPAT